VGRRFTFPSGEAANTAFHTYGSSGRQMKCSTSWTLRLRRSSQQRPAVFLEETRGRSTTHLPDHERGGGWDAGGSTSGLTNPGPMKIDFIRWYTAQ